jgi:hypothetical protein
VRRAENLAFLMYCLEIFEASTSWSPQELLRPAQQLLYIQIILLRPSKTAGVAQDFSIRRQELYSQQ